MSRSELGQKLVTTSKPEAKIPFFAQFKVNIPFYSRIENDLLGAVAIGEHLVWAADAEAKAVGFAVFFVESDKVGNFGFDGGDDDCCPDVF